MIPEQVAATVVAVTVFLGLGDPVREYVVDTLVDVSVAADERDELE